MRPGGLCLCRMHNKARTTASRNSQDMAPVGICPTGAASDQRSFDGAKAKRRKSFRVPKKCPSGWGKFLGFGPSSCRPARRGATCRRQRTPRRLGGVLNQRACCDMVPWLRFRPMGAVSSWFKVIVDHVEEDHEPALAQRRQVASDLRPRRRPHAGNKGERRHNPSRVLTRTERPNYPYGFDRPA
jgi:hypothetical protein